VAEAARDDASFDEVTLTLVRLGSAGARVVLPNLASLSGPARAAAAEAVVRVADPPLVPLLAELAASPEPDVRIAALRALGKAQSVEALEPLILLLADPEHEGVAARALLQLAASYKDEVRQRLEQTVAARASPAALSALARVAGAEAMPLLRKALRHTDPRVRASSVEATGVLGPSDALELVRVALADESPAVRATAAAALGALRADGRAKLFRALFTDSDMGVRAAAAEAVGQAGLTELAPDLERALSHTDGQWAASAVRALGRLGTFSADALAQAARHPDPEVIKEGLRAGVTLAESVPIARESLKNRAWDVRVAAARSLASAAGAESLSAVREALRVEVDPLAREALEEAAERLARR
jgi:HEAT repeat protein